MFLNEPNSLGEFPLSCRTRLNAQSNRSGHVSLLSCFSGFKAYKFWRRNVNVLNTGVYFQTGFQHSPEKHVCFTTPELFATSTGSRRRNLKLITATFLKNHLQQPERCQGIFRNQDLTLILTEAVLEIFSSALETSCSHHYSSFLLFQQERPAFTCWSWDKTVLLGGWRALRVVKSGRWKWNSHILYFPHLLTDQYLHHQIDEFRSETWVEFQQTSGFPLFVFLDSAFI